MKTMRAVGYTRNGELDAPDALVDLELPVPQPGPRDLRVAVRAVSVNPIDTKQRRLVMPANGAPRVLGFDAAGIVDAVGSEVRQFRPGDRVWYAGTLNRPGSNAEWQCVDEQLVAKMPDSLDFRAAAAMPLTALTAWELLFDRLQVQREAQGSLLLIGGAGGVGSMLIALARQRTSRRIIATASRADSRDWCLRRGAHAVIDHREPLDAQLRALGVDDLHDVASLTQTHAHWPAIVEAIAPQGRVALIDDPELFDFRLAKRKSVSIHWESMFTRSVFATPDQAEQGRILGEVARLIDTGQLDSSLNTDGGMLSAATLREAHRQIETGHSIGKCVLDGYAG